MIGSDYMKCMLKQKTLRRQIIVSLIIGCMFSLFISACGSLRKNLPMQSSCVAYPNAPPTPKEAIQILIRNHDIPLTIHNSCFGVGTDFDDITIGDYISGFLAELTGISNSIIVSCAAATKEGEKASVWRCEVIITHADEEDEWRWGVRFDIDKRTGTLILDSVRCIGMG